MMKAWAAIAAAAVLVALPVSVQQASGDAVRPEVAPAPTVADLLGGAAASAPPAAGMGVVLWLAVAVLAGLAALLVLRRSRTHLTPVPDQVAPSLTVVSSTTTRRLTRTEHVGTPSSMAG